METLRVIALIPAFQEGERIAQVIEAVKTHVEAICVIDDGSTDNTTHAAQQAGAVVFRHDVNCGKGAATETGLRMIRLRWPHADAVILLDADGQHDPNEIPQFIEFFKTHRADLIIGSRQDRRRMPWIRRVTNIVMSGLLSRITREPLTDISCGYRLISRRLAERLDLRTQRYEIDTEMLIQAAQLGMKIAEIPIRTIYQTEKSKIRPFQDTCRFIWYLARRPR